MNKQLSPLEALEDIILYLNATEPDGFYCENIKIIKNVIKDYDFFLNELRSGEVKIVRTDDELVKQKKVKALKIIKELLEEDCCSDLLPILRKYKSWEEYDYACNYKDENPIIKNKEHFNLLKEVLL